MQRARSWKCMTVASAIAVSAPHPGSDYEAQASILSDIGHRLSPLRALRNKARALANDAAEGIREEANKFIDEKIDPMLSRVDAFITARIDQATAEANTLLDKTETALLKVVDYTNGKINDTVDHFFAELNKTADQALIQVDRLMNDALCRVAPDGRGLRINLPFTTDATCIKVANPAGTHCYRYFPGAISKPSSATFCGREFYRGEICETELALAEVNPSSAASTLVIANHYAKIASLASKALCVDHILADREYFVSKELQAEERADLFTRMHDGTALLTKHKKALP